MTTTIIIVAKNEAEGIVTVIRSVKKYADEIIVVDGHSTDGTALLSKREGIRVLRDHGLGRGDGVRIGLAKATGDIVVLFDADGSHEPRDIPKLTEPIVDGKADLVIASRRTGGSFDRQMDLDSLVRSFGADILTMLVNLRFRTQLTDVIYSFRALRASLVKKLPLTSNGFAIEQELVVTCLRNRFKVLEIPSREFARRWGKPKLATANGIGLLLTLLWQLFRPSLPYRRS